jgi:hypothetical protein
MSTKEVLRRRGGPGEETNHEDDTLVREEATR